MQCETKPNIKPNTTKVGKTKEKTKKLNQKNSKIMTQKEFTDRTGVQVTATEYNAIEEVYVNCDLEKDEFCKVWAQMNASRVAAAKEAAKQQRKEEELRDKLYSLYNQLGRMDWDKYAIAELNDRQKNLLDSVGIELIDQFHALKQVYSLKYDLGKYLGIIK